MRQRRGLRRDMGWDLGTPGREAQRTAATDPSDLRHMVHAARLSRYPPRQHAVCSVCVCVCVKYNHTTALIPVCVCAGIDGGSVGRSLRAGDESGGTLHTYTQHAGITCGESHWGASDLAA